MPEFVSPQLATLVEKPPEGDQWFHELKFDGYRMICHLKNGKVKFFSRNGKDWTTKFPNIGKALKELGVKTAILDGEVVAVDKTGRASFQKLQQSIGTGDANFTFHLFDVIYLEGFSLVKMTLKSRKELLAQVIVTAGEKSPLRYSDHVEGNGEKFFAEACKFGIEGVVSKLADSTYDSTRSRSWLKSKCIKRQEFVIAGYTESDKNFPGFGSIILGVYEKGKLIYVGRAGTGFTIKQRLDLREKLDKLVRRSSPFESLPKDPGLRRAVWAAPKLVGEVAFTEWTDDGVIRHPSFQGLRVDKKASEVVREKPAP